MQFVCGIHDFYYLWPDLQKPDIMTHFGNPDFCMNEFHKPKALFCSNINAILQILFELQG